jgi:class 3 adenylate cyclase
MNHALVMADRERVGHDASPSAAIGAPRGCPQWVVARDLVRDRTRIASGAATRPPQGVEAAVPEQSVVSPQSHGIIPLRRNRQEGMAGASTIAEWLASLGLSEYAQRFAENGIDLDVLQHLTDQDLKDIGVVLGHRRKMLAAIARVAGAVASPAAPPPEPKPQDTAERRQITVLFSDLVGSTALSARMDPEDLREVISAYQKCVAETVRHFDGFVAKYLGDGALVYFGYPQAHEDDAERAVRAGLDLIAAVSALKSSDPLKTRVGIATGLVVVGDLIVSGEARERGIVGETPNLAARLQGIADPNMVVIADSTRRLLGNLFELQDLGPRELKGISRSTRAWAALRPSSMASRFEALRGVLIPTTSRTGPRNRARSATDA